MIVMLSGGRRQSFYRTHRVRRAGKDGLWASAVGRPGSRFDDSARPRDGNDNSRTNSRCMVMVAYVCV
jgi:hypothetical protein